MLLGRIIKKKITEIRIADGVTSIGTLAMYDILSVSKINIPFGVTTIGQGALAGNKLKSVEIPNTVTSIGVNAFETDLLETLTIPDSVKYITGKANVILPNITMENNVKKYSVMEATHALMGLNVMKNIATACVTLRLRRPLL